MRIVHVVENLERGGLERVVIDLASAQRSAVARTGSWSSARYRDRNSSNLSGTCPYHLRNASDGATAVHHSSRSARALLTPRGHRRSTRTLIPSSDVGGS